MALRLHNRDVAQIFGEVEVLRRITSGKNPLSRTSSNRAPEKKSSKEKDLSCEGSPPASPHPLDLQGADSPPKCSRAKRANRRGEGSETILERKWVLRRFLGAS